MLVDSANNPGISHLLAVAVEVALVDTVHSFGEDPMAAGIVLGFEEGHHEVPGIVHSLLVAAGTVGCSSPRPRPAEPFWTFTSAGGQVAQWDCDNSTAD